MRHSPDTERFAARADSAAFWEAWVGAVLARAGLYTLHHPFTVGSEVGRSNESYAQSHDLDVFQFYPWAIDEGKPNPVQVEVKSSNALFTGAWDYPFPSVMVCSQSSFLKKWPGASKTGRDFLFVSRVTGNILWLPVHSPVTVGHETFDAKRGEAYKTVHAAKSDLRDLHAFTEYVRGN